MNDNNEFRKELKLFIYMHEGWVLSHGNYFFPHI